MTAKPNDDRKASLFDDPKVLSSLMDRSFHEAKQDAIAENDRKGVTSYGTSDGKIIARQPKRAARGIA